MIKSTFHLCVVTFLVLIASQAWAISMVPGQASFCVNELEPLGGTVVAGPLVSPLLGAAFTGTLTSTVFENDASNPWNATGGLTFVYQVANDASSVDAIGRVTITGYNGWLTDMSISPLPVPGLPPTTMDRSLTGDVVGYSFIGQPIGLTVLSPGAVSMVLVVQTNARGSTTSTGYVIDGSIASGPAYAPAVPEPATMLLLLGGLGWLMRRR